MRFGTVDIPEDLYYSKKHLWARIRDKFCTLGLTDYIQNNAGDVLYVELSEKGTVLEVNQDFGSIETSKWVDKLYSPLDCQLIEVNDQVIKNPEIINKAPFTEGWLIKVELEGEAGSQSLMSHMEYFEYIKSIEEQ